MQIHLKDTRDNRGKKHDLSIVALGFLLAILRSTGKLSVSKIHRKMQRDYPKLVEDLGGATYKCVSRAQLVRILDSFDYRAFNGLNQNYFGQQVGKEGLEWYAVDGKELRGSIDTASGEKRGENIVLSVNHSSKESEAVGYYSGKKESEKTVARQHFERRPDLSGRAFSFDALHNSSDFLATLEKRNAVYLAQVKSNQKVLMDDLGYVRKNTKPFFEQTTVEKAHGRIETRKAWCYAVPPGLLDGRWQEARLATFIYLERERIQVKNGKTSWEPVYFASNLPKSPANGEVLFEAVRGHWKVEVNNNIRDSNLGEDRIISRKQGVQRSLAAFINVAINRLQAINEENNLNIVRENLCEDRDLLYQLF